MRYLENYIAVHFINDKEINLSKYVLIWFVFPCVLLLCVGGSEGEGFCVGCLFLLYWVNIYKFL